MFFDSPFFFFKNLIEKCACVIIFKESLEQKVYICFLLYININARSNRRSAL